MQQLSHHSQSLPEAHHENLVHSLTSEAVSRNPLHKQLEQLKHKVTQHFTEYPGPETTNTKKSAAAQHTYPLFPRAASRLKRFKTYAKLLPHSLPPDVATLRHKLNCPNLKLRLPPPPLLNIK
jgi:hypothetical protein